MALETRLALPPPCKPFDISTITSAALWPCPFGLSNKVGFCLTKTLVQGAPPKPRQREKAFWSSLRADRPDLDEHPQPSNCGLFPVLHRLTGFRS